MGDQDESIEIRVDKISQLFDSLDPFPFRERDLDRHAEEYIVSWARELPHDKPIRIVIHVPASEFKSEHAKELNESFHRYFEYRAGVTARELKQLFSIGRNSALIGAAVLAICILGAQVIPKALGTGNISIYLRENLYILGWVANWKPLEIFLYEWWPIAKRRNLYRRLSGANVQLKPAETSLRQPSQVAPYR